MNFVTIEDLISPPPSGAYPFLFTDEAGTVSHAIDQPFFGIGLLKLSDAGRWNDALNDILDRATNALSKPGVKTGRSFEFKFTNIGTNNISHFETLIDHYVQQPDAIFCALIVDKNNPGVDPVQACGSMWGGLIKYGITLIRKYVFQGEKAIVISDNHQKPKASPEYYERQVVSTLRNQVANAIMVDSRSSMLLQLVDVLLGCVMYHYKLPTLRKVGSVHAGKSSIADRLCKYYGRTSLVGSWTALKPNYFSVWPLRPRRLYGPAVPAQASPTKT